MSCWNRGLLLCDSNKKKYDATQVLPAAEPVGDKKHRCVKSGISMVSVAGSALTYLLESIIQNRAAVGRGQCIRNVSNYLKDLVDKGPVAVGSVRNDELVVTAILELTQAALSTHDEDRLEHLQNAVRNIVTNACSFDEAQESVLKNMAAQLTQVYFKVLLYAEDPSSGFSRGQIVTHISELGSEELASLVWSELRRFGLVEQEDLVFRFKDGYGTDNCLTSLGNQLKGLVT